MSTAKAAARPRGVCEFVGGADKVLLAPLGRIGWVATAFANDGVGAFTIP